MEAPFARSIAQVLPRRARVELELDSGNPDHALHCLDELIQSIPIAESSRLGIRLSLLRGEALNALGTFDQAESWLISALDSASQLGARAVLWRIPREIGLYLSISERTVESHITEILKRLGLGSRAQVAAWAVESGLVNWLNS